MLLCLLVACPSEESEATGRKTGCRRVAGSEASIQKMPALGYGPSVPADVSITEPLAGLGYQLMIGAAYY